MQQDIVLSVGLGAALWGTPVKARPLGQGESATTPFSDDGQSDLPPIVPSPPLKESELVQDIIVIGGCAGGLSLGACLLREGVKKFLIFEKNPRSGDQWRNRYHRLHLHDIIEECHLPLLPMPDSFPVYPSRLQFAQYLDSYQSTLRIPVRYSHTVKSAKFLGEGKGWSVEVRDETAGREPQTFILNAKHLVVANGVFNVPVIPRFEGADLFRGLKIHTSEYKNATLHGLKGKKVLVIGFGNSGAEILIDLYEHGAKPTVLIRSPAPLVPRAVMGGFQRLLYRYAFLKYFPPFWILAPFALIALNYGMTFLAWLKFGSLSKYSLKYDPRGVILPFLLQFEAPLMDVGTVELIKAGHIKVIPGNLTRFTPDGAVFENGTEDTFDAVVYATGFEMMSGHKHFLDAETFARVGHGKDALYKRLALPGKQAKNLASLWFLYGRLQMLRDVAPGMAKAMAAVLKKTESARL